jgi:hypothetical protein
MRAEQLLAEGLAAGYGSGSVKGNVNRGGFSLKSSHYEPTEGGIYHDEYAADLLGGGQELVEVDGIKLTRVYAGGTLPEEELKTLGITKTDVLSFLKEQMSQNGDKIRLYDNFTPERDESDPWNYSYVVTRRHNGIPLTEGTEIIEYKGKVVFVHSFLICPVK